MTGGCYDQAAIPSEFSDVERLQKLVEPRDVIKALAGKTAAPREAAGA